MGRLGKVLGAIAVFFGIATVISGGKVLFGGADAQQAAGAYVPFVVWFNFLAGFLYIACGIGLFRSARWSGTLASALAAATVFIFALFGVHVWHGGPYEARTPAAMVLRSTFWLVTALAIRTKRHAKTAAVALIVTFGLSGGTALHAAEIEGIAVPDQISVNGKNLDLNGAALYKITFLSIRVFAAGLYLESKVSDPDEIGASTGIKHIRVLFFKSVGRSRLASSWKERITESCSVECDQLAEPISSFTALFDDVKSGDILEYTMTPDKLTLTIRGVPRGSVTSKALSGAMLSSWIGTRPLDENVKQALLGKHR